MDFVVNDVEYAIEAKATANVHRAHLVGLRELARDHPRVKRRIVVCREPKPRRTEDGIDVLPAKTFAERLWADRLVSP